MAMFVTFYSFKGGVGRTLALANMATRLAQDDVEPCRVLVWDFDLAAPGLQQVFKCQGGSKRPGFVELVYRYLSEAEIGDVTECISRTNVDGVDILPAGQMNRQYAAKLDQIHWREIYEYARGFSFIDAIKKQISEISPPYDYVLIDSLTGYSDVGGICVNQLPDIVVLLFRLNQQNITGISKVYQGIRSADTRRARPSVVVPVISPAWPFASPESDEWLSKVKRVFPDDEILSISFEGSLTFGEKIISKERKGYTSLRILDDYEHLTNHIRSLNSQDLRTINDNVRKLREENQFREALEACIKLVKQRPERPMYWRQLVSTLSLSPWLLRKKLTDAATKAIDEQAESGNPHALIARAELQDRFAEDWQSAYRTLTRAIETAPEFEESYYRRGAKGLQHRLYRQAAEDFSRFLELQKSKGGTHLVPAALAQRAYSLLRLGDFQSALRDVDEAVKLEPNDEYFLVHRATTLLLSHHYSEAEKDTDKALELSPSNQEARLLKVHLLATAGQKDAAKRELQKIEHGGVAHLGLAAELAEVYLVVEPSETLRVLKEYMTDAGSFEPVCAALRLFAAELLQDDTLSKDTHHKLLEQEKGLRELLWIFTHFREFLHWAPQRKIITAEQQARLHILLDFAENPDARPDVMSAQLTLTEAMR